MKLLFLAGQAGIFFEILGAAYLVYAAYESYKNLRNKSHTVNAADVIESTLNEIRGQYKKELIGFAILTFGLLLQFIGGCVISNRYEMITTKGQEGECLIKLDKQTGEAWQMCPRSTWGKLPATKSFLEK